MKKNYLSNRFRGFYPVVLDVETAGLNPNTDALLEIAICTLKMDNEGWLKSKDFLHFHIEPFIGSILHSKALSVNKIDPSNPLRKAVKEYEALSKIFNLVNLGIKNQKCNKAIIVAHNAFFDHAFLMAAAKRAGLLKIPFHSFVTFDTATLSGIILGQTVLAKACIAAGIKFNNNEAHSAYYDVVKTTKLFCNLVNSWKKLGGWPFNKKIVI